VLGLGGGLAGSVLGTAVAGALGPSIAGMKVAIPWSPLLMGAGTAGSAVTALLASLVPAIQATRVEPVRALRFL
ncbi:MAG TPA: ABC transporter permease, partial [Firmicutes bacterium]|nr:ABC transporter permease [Bacillota bacterium]